MADFHQDGLISTLHRLGRPDVPRLERELRAAHRTRPIALVLPCLHAELRARPTVSESIRKHET